MLLFFSVFKGWVNVIMIKEYILFGMTGYVVFRLLVNIGLDSGPDDAQPFVSKWYRSHGGIHQLG